MPAFARTRAHERLMFRGSIGVPSPVVNTKSGVDPDLGRHPCLALVALVSAEDGDERLSNRQRGLRVVGLGVALDQLPAPPAGRPQLVGAPPPEALGDLHRALVEVDPRPPQRQRLTPPQSES